MNKTPEQIAIQKAVVCLYLRKRRARKFLRKSQEERKNLRHGDVFVDEARGKENEAHNALESLKRVLWNNKWS